MDLAVQTPAAARAAAGVPGAATPLPIRDEGQALYHCRAMRWPGQLLEIRSKLAVGMRQEWFTDPDEASRYAIDLSTSTDVYVGVVPRTRRAGGKDALASTSRWAWVECDAAMAVERALTYRIPPPFVISSSPGKAHCYWFLAAALPLELLERANRRLAWELGGDMKACDSARILRVAGTRNHKYGEPRRVSITRLEFDSPAIVSRLVGDLPDPAPPRPLPPPRPTARVSYGPDADKDALAAVPSRVYIEALSGRPVLHDMAQCPWHGGGQERTPSLHVGGPQDTLFHCFGCDEGGDIFRFAARMWGLDEARDFPEVKRRLKDMRL